MICSKVRFGAVAVLFAIIFAGIGAGTALAVQSHMVNAKSYLNSALSELEQGENNKGGHRANAINYVKEAIGEVSLGIQYAQ